MFLSQLTGEDITEEQRNTSAFLHQLSGYEIPADRWDIIAEHGHNRTLGHGGLDRTLAKLNEVNEVWPDRTKHVRRYIKMCPCCQKMDAIKRVIHSRAFTVASYGLWETVSIDFIERLQPDEFGNDMIIVMIDDFSRFTELYATKSTCAEGAADALISFMGRYSTPSHITTDCGANFTSQLIAGLVTRLGVHHHLTVANSKEQNSICERQNKEVIRHLKNLVFDARISKRWSKYLPLVQRIINTAKNSSTGLSPAEIVFPSGMQFDRGVLTETPSIVMSSYMSDMQYAQARIIALALETQRAKDAKHLEERAIATPTVFANGTYVLSEHIHNPLRRGPKSKLLPFLKGPRLVKSHDNEDMYVLQDLVTSASEKVHISKLRPFLYDERTLTPLQAAITDEFDEFIPETCLGMRGDIRGSRKNLEFKIRWAGYGPENDTWESWENVRGNRVVYDYLFNHPLKRAQRLLPKDYLPMHMENIAQQPDAMEVVP